MISTFTLCLLLAAGALVAKTPLKLGPQPAPDFTITSSDGQVRHLYPDYVNQQKIVVIEAFFTTCPPCNVHAPYLQALYAEMQAAFPGKVEFILLSTLTTDTNVKVAQYKTSKGLTMPAAGKDGGSIAALQPYMSGQWGPFQGTPTFFMIAPGSGAVTFDIRGNTPEATMALIRQKIEALLIKPCLLQDPFGAALDSVEIAAQSPALDTVFFADSSYDISKIAALKNTNYLLKPHKTGDPYEGLTTYDLVLISKHILAIEPLKCPWQILAADVNCSGSVTTFDIVLGRKVILGLADTFPCGTWRFMPDSASFNNGFCQDFVGVKIGNINAGPCTDSLGGAPAQNRSQEQMLYFREHIFEPGETAICALYFDQNTLLEGLQFALEFEPRQLKVKTVLEDDLPMFGAENYRLKPDELAISWVYPQGKSLAAGTPVLQLELTAPQGGALSELLHFSPAVLLPEAYVSGGAVLPLALAAYPDNGSAFTIAPNPARERFGLWANEASEGEILLQLMDLQGKTVFQQNLFAQKGRNHWEIFPSKLPAGLYLIKVNGQVTGRVVFAR